MNNNRDLVTLELSLLAKKKGFNELCYEAWDIIKGFEYSYTYPMGIDGDKDNNILRPTRNDLQTWLRVQKGLHVYVYMLPSFDHKGYYTQIIGEKKKIDNLEHCISVYDLTPDEIYKSTQTYEEALDLGLFHALSMLDETPDKITYQNTNVELNFEAIEFANWIATNNIIQLDGKDWYRKIPGSYEFIANETMFLYRRFKQEKQK